MRDALHRSFRGITTIEDVKGRCRLDDFSDCWHWQGGMKTDARGGTYPALWVFDTLQGKFRVMTGPLAVLELQGKRTSTNIMGWRTCRCSDCLNPEHVAGGTRAEWGAWMKSTGFWKNVPARVASSRKASRANSGTLPETVRAVRESPLNGRQAAQEFGLTESHISKLRTRTTWADSVVPGASVFTLAAMIRRQGAAC